MQSVKQELLAALGAELERLSPGAGAHPSFESPKVAAHGDWASTAALQLAKPLKQNPRQLAQQLCDALCETAPFRRWTSAVEVAGPGFLNIRLKPEAKQQAVREVLAEGERFGTRPANGQRVLVEFVSANPTGPLHVGHGRQAALGDAICNLLEAQGWDVTREFYYNDAGAQIATLARSVQLRARGVRPGDAGWPSGDNAAAYNGDYVQDIADDFLARKTVRSDDRATTASGDAGDLDNVREFAVAYLRHEQDLDLRAFGVRFDNYYLESSLYASGRVEATVARLVAAGKTYEQDGALWLRSTDYVLHTMVRVMRGGQEVKISKRAGSYVTLRDLIEWTSKDAVRFFLLSRKPDTEYTFDVDLAVAQNNDNPVYYVQYAHARICSVLAAWGGDAASLVSADLSPLESPPAQALMLQLARYPEMLREAAADFAPHDVTFYLRELAATYHAYYDSERILVDDEPVRLARLALVAAAARVLHNGLGILGVSAPAKM